MFKLKNKKRAIRDDGVEVGFIDQFHVEYRKAGRYIKLYTEGMFKKGQYVGEIVTVPKTFRWSDGTVSTSEDVGQLKNDIQEALKLMESEVRFVDVDRQREQHEVQ